MASNLKRNLAVLMLGAAATTGVGLAASGLASAQQSPTPPAPSQSQAIDTQPKAGGAPEAAEAAEAQTKDEATDASLPGGGHVDAAAPGANVDHQFRGVE